MSPTEDHREHSETPSFIALAVALLCRLLSLLTAQLADLKRCRNRKPPPDWQAHWPALRQSEWNVRQMQAAGAKLILEGQQLDLMTLSWNWVIAPDFNTTPPATYREMHRRFTQTTRFLADAHRLITRHAKRIAKRPLVSLFCGKVVAGETPTAPRVLRPYGAWGSPACLCST